MESDIDATIPPGVARRLKAAKDGFILNVAILTLVLSLMALLIFFLGPTGLARSLVAFSVYLVFYVIAFIKLLDDWQKEKSLLLGKKKQKTQLPSLSQPRITNSNTAPTSQIDLNEMEKLRSGECMIEDK